MGEKVVSVVITVFDLIVAFLVANLLSILFIFCVLVIIRQMIREKRKPSNFFAWAFIVIAIPLLGIPLYLLFGGRKSRWMVAKKRKLRDEIPDIEPIRNRVEPVRLCGIDDAIFNQNRYELLADGEEAFHTFCQEITKARSSIYIMTYILGKDETGREIVKLLTERAREGLDVRILLDGFGSLLSYGRFLKEFREAGGKAYPFMPVAPFQTHASANLRNHRKMAIFDGVRVLTGGQNIDNRFMGIRPERTRFRDFGAIIEGPAVQAFNYIFITDWASAAPTPKEEIRATFSALPPEAGTSDIEIISSGPDIKGDPLWERIIMLLQESHETITIVTPYFVPDEVLLHSLIVKAHAGKKVTLIVPETSNHPVTDLARNHYLRLLNASGVDVLFFKPGVIHAKLILIDGKYAMIGSMNLDQRSLFVNFEVGIILHTKADVEKMHDWVERILPACQSFEDSPISKETRGRVFREGLAHLLVPLL